MNETLDSVFDGSDDEQEQDSIVNQVLDEIGIDMKSKVRDEFTNTVKPDIMTSPIVSILNSISSFTSYPKHLREQLLSRLNRKRMTN